MTLAVTSPPVSVPSPAGNSAPLRELTLFFDEVAVDDVRLGLRLAVGEQLELGVSARQTTSFGPLGNVIWRIRFDVGSSGELVSTARASGVIGPVAARAGLLAFNAPPGTFGDADEADRPDFRSVGLERQPAFGTELGGTLRLGRTLVLTIDPAIYLVAGRLAGRLESSLELRPRRSVERFSVALDGFANPGFGSGHAAVMLTYQRQPRRAPSFGIGIGAGLVARPNAQGTAAATLSVAPGLRAEIAGRLGEGRADASLALEPYRLDGPWWRLESNLRWPLGRGEAHLQARSWSHTGRDAHVALGLGYSLPLELPLIRQEQAAARQAE